MATDRFLPVRSIVLEDMDNTPILVLGGTGSVGRRVGAHLRSTGVPVRAASRRGDTRFDWCDESTWEPALRGVRRMFLMAPDGIAVDPRFVGLAADLGVEHIVLLSSRAIDVIGDQRLLDAERTVRASGVASAVLRADWFAQNFDEGPFREAVFSGELAIPLGDCRQAFVDLDDVAAVAAAALTESIRTDPVYEVTGPRALSFGEVCAIISDVAGRPLEFRGDEAAYRAAQTSIGRPHEAIEGEIASFAALRAAGDSEPLDTVTRLTGRAARPFEEYAAAAAAKGSWNPREDTTAGP